MKISHRKKLPPKLGPKTSRDWEVLAQKALKVAWETRDRRAAGIQAAIKKGSVPKVLKMMNIISEADLIREFRKN